jgi:hypothetical protein
LSFVCDVNEERVKKSWEEQQEEQGARGRMRSKE